MFCFGVFFPERGRDTLTFSPDVGRLRARAGAASWLIDVASLNLGAKSNDGASRITW